MAEMTQIPRLTPNRARKASCNSWRNASMDKYLQIEIFLLVLAVCEVTPIPTILIYEE